MSLPRWLARFNRRFINPRALSKQSWPILVHVGRTSGLERRTPLDATPFDGGFVLLVNYDSTKADWVLNTMRAGGASLVFEGETLELTNPRIIPQDEAVELTDGALKPPPAWVKAEFMAMTAASGG